MRPWPDSETRAFLVVSSSGGRGFFSSREAYDKFEEEGRRDMMRIAWEVMAAHGAES